MSKKRDQKSLNTRQNAKDKAETYQQEAPRRPKKGRGLEEWQSAIDQQIQKAMAEGAFSHLPGEGKPLNLDRNPYSDPTTEMAHRLLKNNDFAPDWVERDQEIRQRLDQARDKLRAAWHHYQHQGANNPAWQNAIARFEAELKEINRKITDFNLTVPILSKQRMLLRLEDEVEKASQPVS